MQKKNFKNFKNLWDPYSNLPTTQLQEWNERLSVDWDLNDLQTQNLQKKFLTPHLDFELVSVHIILLDLQMSPLFRPDRVRQFGERREVRELHPR